VHTGHLMLAQEVLWRLGLDEVCFVPTGEPIELERAGETYTVDTLEALRAGEMRDDDLLFIMGEDALHTMHRWKEVGRILELARIVVALRPGQGPLEFTALEAIDPAARERVMTVQMPLIEISGTELRRRVAAGEAYIERNGLYRS